MSKSIILEKAYNNCLILTVLIIFINFSYLLLNLSGSGLDITDEGFYLNSISHSFDYKSSTSQFGFFYKPIFNLVNENIKSLRLINFFLNFFISYCLIFLLFKIYLNFLKINYVVLQISLIGFSLYIFLSLNIFTPNYNSLTLKGLMIIIIGILIHENYEIKVGSVLIALGGWMVFMGKPSTAFLLAIIILVYLIQKKFFYSIILSSLVALTLLLFSSIIIDGSPILFLNRIIVAITHSQLLDANYSIQDMSKSLITIVAKPEVQDINAIFYTFSSMILIFLALHILFFFKFKEQKHTYIFKIIFILTILFVLFFIQFYYPEWFLVFERYQKLQIFSVLIFSIYVALKSNNYNLAATYKEQKVKIIILFLLLPYVYAFGTNDNLLSKSLKAGIFYMFAGLVILIPYYLKDKKLSHLLVYLISGLIICFIHLNVIIEKPYRQKNSLRLNNSILQIKNEKDYLILTEDRVKYINNARNIVSKAGLKDGNYILDLTGKSPGLIFLFNAKSLGSPWLIGGYPGSLKYAVAKLKLEDCNKISKSLIIQDEESRNISSRLINSYGASLYTDYKSVGSWQVNEFKGNYIQKLFKPVNSKQLYRKCIKSRK